MKTTHELKCVKRFFSDVATGQKPFEVRINDRDYRVGDMLWLREGDFFYVGVINDEPEYAWQYTDRSCVKEVTYVLTHEMFEGVRNGYVVLGLKGVIA